MHASSETSPTSGGEHQFSVLLFAGLRDAMKCDEIKISLSSRENDLSEDALSEGALSEAALSKGTPTENPPTVADLLAACARQFPMLADWLPHVRVAVNCEYCNSTTPLQIGDEIAFIPPVAGG